MSQFPKPRLGLRLLRHATLAAAALALGLAVGEPAHAQTMTNSFGGFSKNSGEPIDIESDVLVVHDAKKYATFKGNVKAVQGTTTLRAAELDVHYVGGGGDTLTAAPGATETPAKTDPKAGEAKAGGGTQISKIEARGEVIITSDKDQTTTSEWALYDVPAQLVTVGGNVVLIQGKNVLKGDRLVIDLKTGESRFENQTNTVAGGRIRALFMPSEDAKSGDAKDAKSSGDAKDAKSSGDDKKADETAGDKSGDEQSGKESSDSDKAAEKPTDAAKPPSDSEAWQLLPGQQ